jgi:hypothetical protein
MLLVEELLDRCPTSPAQDPCPTPDPCPVPELCPPAFKKSAAEDLVEVELAGKSGLVSGGSDCFGDETVWLVVLGVGLIQVTINLGGFLLLMRKLSPRGDSTGSSPIEESGDQAPPLDSGASGRNKGAERPEEIKLESIKAECIPMHNSL